MSRITVPAVESATGATAEVYAQVKKAAGSIPNLFVALGALAPEALEAVLNAEGALGAGTLSKQEVETIKLLVSELTGCDYCVAAHTVLGKMTGLSAHTLRQIRAGQHTGDARRDALVRLCRNCCKPAARWARRNSRRSRRPATRMHSWWRSRWPSR
jgi:AhpD family alkylhydroperoxidase